MRLLTRSLAAVVSAASIGLGLASCLPDASGSADGGPVVAVSTDQQLLDTYATAAPGTTIELLSGTYQPPRLRRAASAAALTSDETVTLRAKDGNDVQVDNLDVGGPLAVQGLHLTGIIRFRPQAIGASLDSATVQPGNVIVQGDQVRITNNRIEGPPDRDALDIVDDHGVPPVGVVVQGNVLGPGTLTPGSVAHVDCLQVMSAVDLLVADNQLFDCPAQTLLVKSDLGPIRDVTIIRNALRGCRPRTDTCPAYMTLQVVPGQFPMSDIRVEGNSIAGALRALPGMSGVVVASNAISHVEAGCEYLTTGNVVGTSRCPLPPGNVQADPTFLDIDSDPPDLRPAGGSAVIDQGGNQSQSDATGRKDPCGPAWDAGAYERCND